MLLQILSEFIEEIRFDRTVYADADGAHMDRREQISLLAAG